MSPPAADVRLLFVMRCVRMFAYGLIGIVLVLYLAARGLEETRIGLLLTLTFLGDAAISLWLSTRADRWGRRRTLSVGAILMAAGGVGMGLTGDFTLLVLAATIGVISPSGNEVGPFLAVEQAGLAQLTNAADRTRVFAWYNVAGFVATAAGAFVAGVASEGLQMLGWEPLASYRAILAAYGLAGGMLAVLSARLSPAVEAPVEPGPAPASLLGLGPSRGTVLRLSALFSLDAFAGGFIVQSFLVFWFHQRFGVGEMALGGLFFGANLLSGLSALAAVPLARRIGLVNTMVWTHLPSNVLLMAVPLMPDFGWAVGMLLLRHTISQMDVPTRQSYVNAVVSATERSAANGVTGTARQLGTALAPLCAGLLPAAVVAGGGWFYLAGGLKIMYDLALWRGFRRVQPPEEKAPDSR